jgi:tetratricopeptide (TPR) repeat protein
MSGTVIDKHPLPALAGARVSFTGRLATMSQREAFELVRRAGGRPTHTVSRRTAMVVIGMYGWPLLPDGQVSSKLRYAEELIRHGRRIRLVSEALFLELAGLRPRSEPVHKSYPAERICELLGISEPTLHRWEQLSLIRSEDGRYDFQDVVSLRAIADLAARGIRPDVLNRSLRGLSAILPGTDRPLAQLRIVTENRHSLLAELEDALISADGQLLLNFDRPAPEGTAAAPVSPATPRAWFEYGQECEESGDYPEAARAYGQAISLQPTYPEAHFNLGNVVRATGSLETALELYRTASQQDPQLACAWYNMADVQEELGDFGGAVASLQAALHAAPDYPDAHYNLARCAEKTRDLPLAIRHWSAYLRLDPTSEWGDEARRRLAALDQIRT